MGKGQEPEAGPGEDHDVEEAHARVAEAPPVGAKGATPAWSARLDQGLSWGTCGPLHAPPPAPSPGRDGTTRIAADSAELLEAEQSYIFTGHVDLTRGQRRAQAEHARYDRKTSRVTAEGNVYYEQPDLRFTGATAELDLENDQGWLEDVEYRLIESNARGNADRVFVETPSLSHYENISYTTCRPGNNDWELFAKDLTLDAESGLGTAHNAKLKFKGIPVLYTPYLRFPMDDRRQSGFLTPSFGSSQTTGTDFSIPYYFNIAPNMDATLTPRIMSKRGLMLGGEFRYLGETYAGEMAGELVPDDQDASEEDSSTRGQLSFQHRRQLAPRWNTDIDVHWVSDDNYLEDFGDSLNVSSTRNVEQRATVAYAENGIAFRGLVQHFNTIDNSISTVDHPYYRVPQLLLSLDRPDQPYGLTYHLKSEYDYFKHDARVHGHRLTLRPGVSLPLRRTYGHLIPKVRLDYTTYRLTDEEPGQSSNPSRTLPTASLDTGLLFERNLNWLGNAATQTLEPRLFYLYTPNKNQDDLPDFDTANLDLDFSNMFRENRFTGQDRIGDANQVTLALTSRTLSEDTGRELFQATIGQILYFRDRKVQLPGVSEQDNSSSVIIAGVAGWLTQNLNARAGVTWDPHQNGSKKREKNSAELHYQTQDNQVFNLAYRFNRGQESDEENTRFEDVDLSVRWPLNPSMRFVGRWDYSLFFDRTVEAFGGFEYGSCCWTLRAIARHFIKDVNGDAQTLYMVQLELSGLGKIGNKVEDFLERGIYGYKHE